MSISQQIPPVQSIRNFSQSVGVSLRTVEAWVMRGYVPTVKVGRHRLINVAALVATDGLSQFTAARHPAPQRSEERDAGRRLLPSPPNGNYGGDDK